MPNYSKIFVLLVLGISCSLSSASAIAQQDLSSRNLQQSTISGVLNRAESSRRPPTSLAGFEYIIQQQEDTLPEELKSLRAELATNNQLDPAAKAQIEEVLLTAEANLAKFAENKSSIETSQLAIGEAQDRQNERQTQLEKAEQATTPPLDPKIPPADLEKLVSELKVETARLNGLATNAEAEVQRRASRRLTIKDGLATYDERLQKINQLLDAIPTAEATLLQKAQRLELRSQSALATIADSAMKAELARYDAEKNANLLKLEKDILAKQLAQTTTRQAAAEKLLNEKRQQLAAKELEDAKQKQREIKSQHPLLVASYEINTEISTQSGDAANRLVKAKDKFDKIKQQYDDDKKKFEETRKRVDEIGLSGSIGAMLRKRRADLPNPRAQVSEAEEIQTEVNELQFMLFDLNQKLDNLSVPMIIKEIVEANSLQLSGNRDQLPESLEELPEPLNQLSDAIPELIAARQLLLQNATKNVDELFEISVDLEEKERQLVKLTEDFREFINERILWIRSNNLLFSEMELDDQDSLALDPGNWLKVAQDSWRVAVALPVLFLTTGLAMLLLIIFKPFLRQRVNDLGEIAARGSCDTFWPTARTLVITILITITLPIGLLFLGLGLQWQDSAEPNVLTLAFASALLSTAWFAIPVGVLRRICRLNGLAHKHFDWSDQSISQLKRNLTWGNLVGVVIVFAHELFHSLNQTHQVDLLERSLFIAGMFALSVFLYRCFNPKTGVFAEYLKSHDRSWANQTSAVWFGGIMLLPIFLASLAIWGYYYTALNLSACAYGTFVLAVIAETARAMLSRFILVRRRRVHIEAARKNREAQRLAEQEALREARKAAAGGEPVKPLASTTTPAPEVLDLGTFIDENAFQAQKFVSIVMVLVWAIGLWVIWTDVLPALKGLDNYTVWPAIESTSAPAETAAMTPPAATTSAAQTTPAPIQEVISSPRVTVRDLLLFFIITIATYVSAVNLPSAMEIMFLDDLPVDRSFRYAVKALISYAIVIVGTVMAFNALSISWSNVQWLATALTFGLAFGLQEIFANFVAGIILMFERPMRIGDMITVDDYTGTVTKIRTRATTIVNWDRKEYVIPNKDFITGRLVNWTLTDEVNRLIVNVGVAYGSDVEKAKQILLDICQANPSVLSDPPTTVTFQEFGDSTLNLVLRTFLPNLENRLAVIDSLHIQINDAFKKNQIEIAFPQRDLHIRTVDTSVTNQIQGKNEAA